MAQGPCAMGTKVCSQGQLLYSFFPQLLNQAMSPVPKNTLDAIACMRKGPVVLGSHL